MSAGPMQVCESSHKSATYAVSFCNAAQDLVIVISLPGTPGGWGL